MTLGDYINSTIHHVWFFLLAILLFFSGSLAIIKEKIEEKFSSIVTFGIFVLVLSSYCFFKGAENNQFWPALKTFSNQHEIMPYIILTIIVTIILLISIIIIISRSLIKKKLPTYLVGIMPIMIFFLLVVIPYLSGMIQGYIEKSYASKDNNNNISVTIETISSKQFNDVYIIKNIEKGIVFREFNKNNDGDKFIFLNWYDTRLISYHNAKLNK
jgi:hypothetical protein